MKRMELLALSTSDLVERLCLAESMWQESVEKRDALTATITQKDAEIERLRGVIREMMDNLICLEFDQTAYDIGEKALEVNDD